MEEKKKEKEGFLQEDFTDKWSTFKYLTGVQSDLKHDVTSDFILAKLRENQKEAIIELVRDAYFAKKEVLKLTRGWNYKIDRKGKYIKNDDKTFKKFPLDLVEIKYIKNLADITFNSYMIKMIMTVIMYRNIEQNVLMEMITEKDRLAEESEGLKRENEELTKRVAKNIKEGDKDR